MKFAALLVASLASVAQAVFFTNSAFVVTTGTSFTLTWANATGPVTIKLKNGPSTNLQDVLTVASGQTGTSFTWPVPDTLPSDTYAFEISDGTPPLNYSPQFQFFGIVSSTSSAASTASTTSTSSGSQTTTTGSATTTGSTTTRSTATTTTGQTALTTVPGGDAGRLGSPVALIFLTIAAMLYFQ